MSDDNDFGNCTVCGEPVRWGDKHPDCPKPEAPTDLQKLIADGEHACQTGDCGHGRGYECEAQLAQDAKPAKDAGASEWPALMLRELDKALKVQWHLDHPDHAWLGPSVIELATAAYEKLERELAAIRKDHADDWKRIQDAERERDEARLIAMNESVVLNQKLTQERTKSSALVSKLANKHVVVYRENARLEREVEMLKRTCKGRYDHERELEQKLNQIEKALGLLLNRIGHVLDNSYFNWCGPLARIGHRIGEFRSFWMANDLDKYKKETYES